jgi:hypothetical protein
MSYKQLLSYFYKLKNALFQESREEISLVIDTDEILVRGILHPFFYSQSKKRLKETAFLPPSNAHTVSLNRLRYTNPQFCKQHAKTINFPNNTYCGLVTIVVKDIDAVSEKFEQEKAVVIASPMDENKNYIDTTITKVYIDNLGLPMHCDLTYQILNPPLEPYNPQTRLRKMASEIVKSAKYYEDSSPNDDLWEGEFPSF